MSKEFGSGGNVKKKFTIHNFINDSRSVGVLLLLCTAISIIVTNLPVIGVIYEGFWVTNIPFLDSINLPHSPLHIINDLLMVVFFFNVGMEIKRETVSGELSSPSRLTMPLIAALFGVAIPAIIFFVITKGTSYTHGWAIPTATDIAFSLGVLSLLGKAVPHSMKIFLTALAIIDDLCAILIIALFYGSSPQFSWLLGVAAIVVLILLSIKYLPKSITKVVFIIGGVTMWYFMFRSGIHATFAGVILAMLMPNDKLHKYEAKLHVPVSFLIIPLFALANTSLFINASAMSNLMTELSLGIFFGLLIGKPLGIVLSVFILIKARIIRIPDRPNWNIFIGIGMLAGIGFTMSIFVSMLAFEDKTLQDTAKLSTLIASTLSMVIGYLWLKMATKNKNKVIE